MQLPSYMCSLFLYFSYQNARQNLKIWINHTPLRLLSPQNKCNGIICDIQNSSIVLTFFCILPACVVKFHELKLYTLIMHV